MKRYTHLLAAIFVFVVLAGAVFYIYEANKKNSEREEFLSSLGKLSQDSIILEKIKSLQSIEASGAGWFNINSYDSNPTKDTPVHFAAFASSTGLTRAQVYTLTAIFQRYPFIGRVVNNVNISGACKDEQSNSYSCAALEFYLPLPLLTLWFSDPASWYSDGYMYVPFAFSQSNQIYLGRYFSSVKEIAPNWYSFSGKHL